MKARQKKILVADLLCGAGGSSTGCERALAELGLQMELVCVNHWGVAIETHKKNHPEARHYVQDIATVRPHLLVPEGYLDLLMASPTCTHHSVARGGKPTSDQQRSDPWHIITWLTELRVKRLIIENVWEFIGWGPVDARTGRPLKSRKGEYFNAWIDTLRRLGFEPEWRKLNAADYGDATTRRRFILMARSDRKRVAWPAITHVQKANAGLELFPTAQQWKPAREIIDWNLKGKSIFNRKKPLAPKTLARIYAGAVKFGWPEPFLVILRNHMAGQSVDGPLPTIAANGKHIGLAQPVVVRTNMHGRKSPGARGSEDPLMTITTDGGIAFAEPVIVSTAHGVDADDPNPHGRRVKDINEPLGALHAGGGNFAVAEPIILSNQNSGAPRSTEEPLPTITTGGSASDKRQGCARPMLAQPVIMNGRKGNQALGVNEAPIPTLDTKGGVWLAEPFILGRNGAEGGEAARRAHSVDKPMPTSTNRGAGYVVEPFILSRQSEGAPRGVDEPMPTQTAVHSPVLISPYYGTGSGETCNSAEEPLPTVTSKGRFGMVVPVTHSQGGNKSRSVDEPIPTLTTAKGGELAFVTAQFGERDGQAPRVHDLAEPAPVGVTLGKGLLIEPTAEFDILFRMLEPHELAAAMGFNGDGETYEFAGTKTQQIKQIGNAVSVKKMKACVAAIMADAAPANAAPKTLSEAAE